MKRPEMKYSQNTVTVVHELEQAMGLDDLWPSPEPLGGKLPAVTPMTLELLPVSLRALVADVAERMQVPLDFPAVAAVATLAGVVGRRAFIQPKRADPWIVVPNLWGGIVAEPGSLKSPVISEITAPIKALQGEWMREDNAAIQEHQQALEDAQMRQSAWKDEALKANKARQPTPPRPEGPPEAPAERRLMTQDATQQKLHALLASNHGGIFVLRDELAGWLASLETQGRETERPFYLEAWNGDSSYIMDTISRGSVIVDHACVAIFGGIQPSILRRYLADLVREGRGGDGLMQRFQLLVWPDAVPCQQYIDRAADVAAQQRAAAMYRRVASMDADAPLAFRFDDDAQRLFIAWWRDLKARSLHAEPSELMRGHLAKYTKLMPSLALLFALADGEGTTCSLAHARLAASWCDYLETHARRVYAVQAEASQLAAVTLGQKITCGLVSRPEFSLRDLYRKGWSGLSNPKAAKAAVGYLEELHWLRALPAPQGKAGRHPDTYAVNPLLEAHHANC